jgi:hypothetical protein
VKVDPVRDVHPGSTQSLWLQSTAEIDEAVMRVNRALAEMCNSRGEAHRKKPDEHGPAK